MPVEVHDDGRDVTVSVEVDHHGFLYLRAYVDDVSTKDFPKLTPVEAALLAREIERAVNRMNRT